MCIKSPLYIILLYSVVLYTVGSVDWFLDSGFWLPLASCYFALATGLSAYVHYLYIGRAACTCTVYRLDSAAAADAPFPFFQCGELGHLGRPPGVPRVAVADSRLLVTSFYLPVGYRYLYRLGI